MGRVCQIIREESFPRQVGPVLRNRPVVDETDLDTFLLDTASQRARNVRAFQNAVLTTCLKQVTLSEKLEKVLFRTFPPTPREGAAKEGVLEFWRKRRID